MEGLKNAALLVPNVNKSINKMQSHWTQTATDLLTDKCFLIRRYFEQVEYLAAIKEKFDNRTLENRIRYHELKDSAEFQLERFKRALKALGLPKMGLCRKEICKCGLNNLIAVAVIKRGLRYK